MISFCILNLLFFLQIIQESYTYLNINLTNPIRIPSQNRTILFIEHLTQTQILTYQSSGNYHIFDNNFNRKAGGFSVKDPKDGLTTLILSKIFISQNRIGFLSATQNGLIYYVYLGHNNGNYIYTSSQPIVHAFYYINYDTFYKFTKTWYLLVTEKSISTFYVTKNISLLYSLTNFKPPQSKLLGCVQEVFSASFILYCYTNQMQIFQWTFSYAALSPATLSNSNHSFYKHSSQIKKIILKEKLLFIHDQFMKLTVLDFSQNNQIVSFDTNLQNSPFFDVFYFNGFFYLIIKSDFSKFKFISTSLQLRKVESAQNNLNNTSFTQFKIAFSPFNKAINVGYDFQTQKMYPIYLCHDNQQYNFVKKLCEDIPCTINNCEQCKLNENICTACVKPQNLISLSILMCSYRCQIENCYMCGLSNTCKTCQANYQYNNTLNLCILSSQNMTTPNNSNSSNILYNNTNSTTSEQQQQVDDDKFNQIKNQYNNLDSSLFQFQNILKHTNSLQSIRSQVDFLSPLFALFDDYWYYIYHKNSLNNLQVIPLFFYFIKKVNQQRLIPEIINFNKIQNEITFSNEQLLNIFQQFTNQRILLIDNNQTYFLYNIRLLIIQIIFLGFIFIFMKLIFWLIDKIIGFYQKNKNNKKKISNIKKNENNLEQNNSKINKFYRIAKKKVSIQVFLQTIFEGNLIFGSFQIGLQLKNFFYLNFGSKMNLVFLLAMFFLIILFGFIFYLIFRQINRKFKKNDKNSQQKLKIVRYFYNDDYLNRSLLIGFKSITVGFIHSYLLNSNRSQLLCLIIIKAIIIISSLKFNRLFKKRFTKIVKIFYLISSVSLDLVLLFSKYWNYDQSINKNQINLIFSCQLIIIISLISSVVIDLVLQIFFIIRQLLKCKRNKKILNSYFSQNKNLKRQIIRKNNNKKMVKFLNTNIIHSNLKTKKQQQTFQQKFLTQNSIVKFQPNFRKITKINIQNKRVNTQRKFKYFKGKRCIFINFRKKNKQNNQEYY